MSDTLRDIYICPIEDALKNIDGLDSLRFEPRRCTLRKIGAGGFKKIFEIVGSNRVLAYYSNSKKSVGEDETLFYVKRFLHSLQDLYSSPIFPVLQESFCLPVAVYKTRNNRFGFVYPRISQRFTVHGDDSRIWASPALFEEVFSGEHLNVFLMIALKFSVLFDWLHKLKLVYGDISYSNVLVDARRADLYVIDTDGLHDATRPSGGTVKSPWFDVPEIISGKAKFSKATELFCFYIFVYGILMHRHPLRGTQGVPDGYDEEESDRYLYGDHPVFIEAPECPPDELKHYLRIEYHADNKWLDPVRFSAVNVLGKKLADHLKLCFGAAPEKRPDVSSFLPILYETLNSLRPCPDLLCELGWHPVLPKFRGDRRPAVCPDCKTEFADNIFFHTFTVVGGESSYAGSSLAVYEFRSLYPWDFKLNEPFVRRIIGDEPPARTACIFPDDDRSSLFVLNLSEEPVFVGSVSMGTMSGMARRIHKGEYTLLKHCDVVWQGDIADGKLLFADFSDAETGPSGFSVPSGFSYMDSGIPGGDLEKRLRPRIDYYDIWGHYDARYPLAGAAHYAKIKDYCAPDGEFEEHKDEILHHLRIAADQQYSDAQYLLGTYYAQGKGVFADEDKALALLLGAAKNRHPDALAQIRGTLLPRKNYAWLVSVLERIADSGAAEAAYAAYLLGSYHEDADSPVHDMAEAKKWYRIAAKKNITEAEDALERLKGIYTPEPSAPSTPPPAGSSNHAHRDNSTPSTSRSAAKTAKSNASGNQGVALFFFFLSLAIAWLPAKWILSLIWGWLIRSYRNGHTEIYGLAAELPTFRYAWYDWIVYFFVAGFFAETACNLSGDDDENPPIGDDDLSLGGKCAALWGCFIFANPLCFLPTLLILCFITVSNKDIFYNNLTAAIASCAYVSAGILSLYLLYRLIVQAESLIVRKIACAMLSIPALVFIGFAKMAFLFGWAGFPRYLMWVMFRK